jgi:hypothetical protein
MVKYGSTACEWGHRTTVRIGTKKWRNLKNLSYVNTERKKYLKTHDMFKADNTVTQLNGCTKGWEGHEDRASERSWPRSVWSWRPS